VRLYYEVYGSGEPAVFLLPTWSIVHSRHWKMQIPYLARHCRVITFEREFAADAPAVMDATGTAETLVATELGGKFGEEETRELCHRVRCPVLVIQGTADAITGRGCGTALAEATGGQLVLLEGAGHGPHVRDPVKVNLLLRDFVAPRPPHGRL
jgi:alpha-beta hydrolase superfamily lysophospholipase